jgi:hypothetical protein
MPLVRLQMASPDCESQKMPKLRHQEIQRKETKGAKNMIEIEYPALDCTVCDTVGTKERAVEVLKNARHRLYEEIAKLDNKIEELSV